MKTVLIILLLCVATLYAEKVVSDSTNHKVKREIKYGGFIGLMYTDARDVPTGFHSYEDSATVVFGISSEIHLRGPLSVRFDGKYQFIRTGVASDRTYLVEYDNGEIYRESIKDDYKIRGISLSATPLLKRQKRNSAYFIGGQVGVQRMILEQRIGLMKEYFDRYRDDYNHTNVYTGGVIGFDIIISQRTSFTIDSEFVFFHISILKEGIKKIVPRDDRFQAMLVRLTLFVKDR